MRKVKIVCTIGPACSSEEMLTKMILDGMDVARFNFSYDTPSTHTVVAQRLRKLARTYQRPISILQDIQGSRIRLGRFANGEANLRAGENFLLTNRPLLGDDFRASIQHPTLARELTKGDNILTSEGRVQLRILEAKGRDIFTRVITGGLLRDHAAIHVPGVRLSHSSITEKDKRDLRLGFRMGADIVAISFVRSPEDVTAVRRQLNKANRSSLLLAKIEHPDAVERLDEILEVADGIVIARGDLGIELPPEKVPAIQKAAIAHANARGKIVVVATQMLDSMVRSPSPTRAESSDVANAVYDGADALVMTEETASGAYPVEALQAMVRIIGECERSAAFREVLQARLMVDPALFNTATARAAIQAAQDIGAHLIIAFTESGQTGRLISGYRPDARIVALTPNAKTFNKLAILWGIEPVQVPKVNSTDAMLQLVNRFLIAHGYARPGEEVVIVCGVPFGHAGSTNLVKLHRIQ